MSAGLLSVFLPNMQPQQSIALSYTFFSVFFSPLILNINFFYFNTLKGAPKLWGSWEGWGIQQVGLEWWWHLFVGDIVGPEFLSQGPAYIVICFPLIFICFNRRHFKFCSVIKYSISQDHTSRYSLKIFINISSRAIFLQMKCSSNLQAAGLISPIRTWNLHQKLQQMIRQHTGL